MFRHKNALLLHLPSLWHTHCVICVETVRKGFDILNTFIWERGVFVITNIREHNFCHAVAVHRYHSEAWCSVYPGPQHLEWEDLYLPVVLVHLPLCAIWPCLALQHSHSCASIHTWNNTEETLQIWYSYWRIIFCGQDAGGCLHRHYVVTVRCFELQLFCIQSLAVCTSYSAF